MGDENTFPSEPNNDDSPSEPSASSLFLEMMRQRASSEVDDIPPTTPPQVSRSTASDSRSQATSSASAPQAAQSDEAARDRRREAAREKLRIERVQRRRKRRRRSAVGLFGGVFQSLFVVGLTAVLAATIFTWLANPDFIAPSVRDDLSIAMATATSQGGRVLATDLPSTPNWLRKIGVVSGHRGPENDPGAVCPDGLTEAEINLNVAQRVVRNLQARGYTVDLLDEFDPRLADYEAELLLSIHANTCQDYGEVVSGYLISTADSRVNSGNDQLLVECVAAHYQQASQLQRRFGLTRDMTDYHIFRQINPITPAAIIELGFMFNDRELLTSSPDTLARGITDGVLCFLEPGDANILATLQAPTPNPILPTASPSPAAESF
jgi:N-acetylmuramoyl-L-alanine amidase